ncbi:hypothetical protein GJ496_004220 [Pomphorhynchus laevis]|nr:hypothetical protein GJ496_004220 [Pomphorhynchus laevis]
METDFMEQVIELTTEEKASIAERIILNTPGGELRSVLSDLRIMLAADSTNSNIHYSLKMASKAYRENQLSPVAISGQQRNCLISPYNNVEDFVYFDLRSNKTFR